MDKKNLFRAVSILFIILQTFTTLQGYMRIHIGLVMFMISIISFILYPSAFKNAKTYFLLLYIVGLFIFYLLGHKAVDIKFITIELFTLLSCISIINVYHYNHDNDGLIFTTVVGLGIIVIMSLSSLYVIISDPNAIRNMITYSNDNNFEAILNSNKSGVASFGLIHAYPILIPLLVYHYKHVTKINIKITFLFVILIPLYMIIRASFATPILLSIILLICSYLFSRSKSNIVILSAILLIMPILLNKELVLSGLDNAQQLFSGTQIENKIIDIANSYESGYKEGQVQGRSDLYSISWSSFFNNPIFPDLSKMHAGGHAYLIDKLALFGLSGVLPFLFLFYFYFKNIYFKCSKDRKIYLLIGFLAFIVLISIKNMVGMENYIYLFVFLPGLSLLDTNKLLLKSKQL